MSSTNIEVLGIVQQDSAVMSLNPHSPNLALGDQSFSRLFFVYYMFKEDTNMQFHFVSKKTHLFAV